MKDEGKDAPSASTTLAGPADPGRPHAQATRLAVMIDTAALFSTLLDALREARETIWIIGWTFDPRTRLAPEDLPGQDSAIGKVLRDLAEERPDLRIRILVWNAAGLSHVVRRLQPALARTWFHSTTISVETDSTLPFGAAMHRKMVIIDDSLAFCPNDDISVNRWDDQAHEDRNRFRRLPSGRIGPPWHANHAVVEGPVAATLAGEARAMWRRATGEEVPAGTSRRDDLWPAGLTPLLRDTEVSLVRTDPLGDESLQDEGLAHFLACIAEARHSLYVESTYLTSVRLRAALAERLKDPDGPEIVLITGRHAPAFLDRAVMDPPRRLFAEKLRQADRHGRLSILTPRSPGGRAIKVHSKLLIADDRLLRIGSHNMSNRSCGYDCELDIVAESAETDSLRGLRHRMIAHFLAVAPEAVARAASATGTIGGAIRQLDPESRRLPDLSPHPPVWRGWLARMHLGDPERAGDAWRPWRRDG